MSNQYTLEELTELFRQAGAKEPESWAISQIEQGINQLGRFCFLKKLTSQWLKEDDLNWINSRIKDDSSKPGDPCSQLPGALKEMIDKQVSREAIIDLVRVIQFETIFHACGTIGNLYQWELPVVFWALHQIDEDDNLGERIDGLHESVLEFDPSDKEMRPR